MLQPVRIFSTRRSSTPANPKLEALKLDWSLDPAAQMSQSLHSSTSTTKILPATIRSVFLCDWWLEKINGKRLAVGGTASRERLLTRVFISAPISKRYCATKLQTTDGMTITISGLINRSRTLQNGIPSKVCDQFLLGFPYDWEEYATLGEESSAGAASTIISGRSEDNIPFSLNDLPETRTHDLLFSTIQNLDYNLLAESICNEIQRPLGNIISKKAGASINSNMECKRLVRSGKSVLNAAPIKCKKVKTDHKSHQLTNNGGVGVSTRRMTRMKSLALP
ncbi:protein EMBRYO DEFECTIVE 1674 isoform X1 [Ziziphus jujuba]|uniref:Protein EMBRYO DEFECTIVE 1674 isoform X1 n=1 Tax=Ziziphus jujuba TaxID=326968 RepID=A0ABM3I777_ZIZJJ|nr:protein EMBRYO DEFECTIVE 1674 isoform X1 [Ziziphus jujuba]XP_048322000.2 protein EMBRYO DEFECTIVE 1674 isoform X1 [Ziziphus jujuba]XP_048322001.2 protein EMBRYO DEFECTIVE 1674 isoform X1 [Ziziphus jujuba]XP_048322002.2 protein EMBRYO DEFECTIVE 1674 isoform X1 [Ziziphus jujuba]XP_048322006.2 protein EMBRYO DEFECTIVE 1674 isoform X1 [Ziziphus jujuba]XP_060669026.1 protein EMBRYO DEFECTIVE 1674 isoform X1 [Ziziphus jujuba]